MMSKIKKHGIFLFVFLFLFFSLWYFGSNKNTMDSIWNYGYSLAIAKGQIPYLDFTMVVTPLYNAIMAMGLIFSHEYIVYILEQSILLTISFCFLYQIYGKKSWFYLVLLTVPYYFPILPSYNTFLFILTTGIIYLEKKEKGNIWIGILISCMFLTKQTVGIFFFIPSIIFYWKKKEIFQKRCLGFCIPIICFLIYLILTNSLIPFIDLCFVGLLDFGHKNTLWKNYYFLISILLVAINIKWIKNDKNNIVLWYALMGYTVLIPIYGTYHFQVYLLFFFLCLLEKPIPYENWIRNFSWMVLVIQSILYFQLNQMNHIVLIKGIHNFNDTFLIEEHQDTIKLCSKLYLKYKKKNKKTYFLSNQTSWIQAITEEDYDYFSVLNRGNFGYNGTKKMIQKIKKMEDAYFMINEEELEEAKSNIQFHQLDVEIIQYVMDHSTLVEEKEMYKVYHYSRK